jgi:hypothetical protein
LAATLLGTLLFGGLWFSGVQPHFSPAIIVGTQSFREKDLVNELKARAGMPVISKLVISALIEEYAKQKNVTASESEIDQLLRMNKNQLELSGQTLDDLLERQGLTLDEFRKDLRVQVLQVKMLVTDDEMRAAVATLAKSGKPPYVLPTRYRIRILSFDSAEHAQEAALLLAQPGDMNLMKALALALNGAQAKRVILYAPGLMPTNPAISAVLAGLQSGQCSRPFKVPGQKSLVGMVQLVELQPAEIPTYADSNILAGQYLMQADPKKFEAQSRALEAMALDTVDLQFYSTDYEKERLLFKQRKVTNPNIPGMNGPVTTGPAPASGAK